MKKQNFLIRSLALGFVMAASTGLFAQVDVGLRAGLNLSSVTFKDGNGDIYRGAKRNPGFHVGVTFDIPVAPDFYIQPGALFSTKGAELRGESWEYFWPDDIYYDGDYTRLTPYYLEVPFNFLYKPYLGSGRLMFGAGPYVAYGLGGRYKDNFDGEINTGRLEFVNDFNDATSEDDVDVYGKPFDFGLNVLGGYEFSNRFSLQLNGQIGLANIEPNDDGARPDASMKNSSIGISVGYKF